MNLSLQVTLLQLSTWITLSQTGRTKTVAKATTTAAKATTTAAKATITAAKTTTTTNSVTQSRKRNLLHMCQQPW